MIRMKRRKKAESVNADITTLVSMVFGERQSQYVHPAVVSAVEWTNF